MRQTLSIACITLVIGLWFGTGNTAMYPLSLVQLSQGAEFIVLGTVTDQVSAWNDLSTAIHTDVIVQVEEVIKGAVGSEVIFRINGGEVGDIGMRTSTDASFRLRERVILFLSTGASRIQLFGQRQGKLTVIDDTVTQAGNVMSIQAFRAAVQAASR